LNRGAPFRAHFPPLNVAATMGLPALAALGFLVVVLWRERRRPTSIATWSGLLGLAVDGLAQDIEHFRQVSDGRARRRGAKGLTMRTRLRHAADGVDHSHACSRQLRQVLQRHERRYTPPLARGQ
jgi:hypothetical protein